MIRGCMKRQRSSLHSCEDIPDIAMSSGLRLCGDGSRCDGRGDGQHR
jgi:hypothetical protein